MCVCSIKLDAVICTSLCRPRGGGRRGGRIYIKCHTRYSRSILSTYWSCFIVAKRFLSYVYMFSSNSGLLFGLIISVLNCRQSGCSYNVESSFVEKRRTCTTFSFGFSIFKPLGLLLRLYIKFKPLIYTLIIKM
jgi:hypothetical protein